MTIRHTGLVLFALGTSAFFGAACGAGNPPAATFEDSGTESTMDDASVVFDLDATMPPVQSFGGKDSGPTTTAGDASCTDDACGPVTPSMVCGDGMLEGTETCDDGNGVPGDGCSGVCTIEPGYTCPVAGATCVYTVKVVCGDGMIEGNEACDDKNTNNMDGCSSSCQVEPGFACATPGLPCTPVVVAMCGDGTVNSGEQCDDKNVSPGDGCDANCKIETGFTCPTPGSPCTKLQYCGDGVLQPATEQCDDKNAAPGDGCSGVCQLEPGYACPTPGISCVRIWICGNGKIDPGEACDDGTTAGTGGCSADCSLVKPGYTCPTAGGNGGPCTKAPANSCGDGTVAGTEQCDDGNTTVGDGCSPGCAVEAGYTCPIAGKPCKKIEFCGDKIVELDISEQCDDGNTTAGDGCSTLCQIEPNYACMTQGQPCVSLVVCGDKKVQGAEQCDDGNTVSGDGCTAGNVNPALSCQVEAGWVCPTAGAKCTAKKCGDGILAGVEQCDDKNNVAGDGCSATCQIEQGYACTKVIGAKSVCTVTTCGNNKVEGFEQCDDGNRIPYDGCSPTCTVETQCAGGSCTAVCGDGLKFPQEPCDDGNTFSGDGCSATCTLETGFTCNVVTSAPPASLTIPVLYRDMLYAGTSSPGIGHPDFNNLSAGLATGLVKPALGADGKPVFLSAGGSLGAGNPSLTTAANYCWWYHDKSTASSPDCGAVGTTNPYDRPVYLDLASKPTTLTLTELAPANSGIYQYNNQLFYPLNGLGWNSAVLANPQTDSDCGGATGENFSFTSEVRFPFTYKGSGSETFDFSGDDDVWVFINGVLAVDLGGVHGPTGGSVTLGTVTSPAVSPTPNPFGLTVGGMYEIAVFQAERHTCGSTYQLTLGGFDHKVTQCAPICGDGKLEGNEVCDDGTNNGTYGSCLAGCMGRGPYCGDGTKQTPQEACDDGSNVTTYGGASKTACGPGCKIAPYCGDGIVSNGEACDEGAKNGTGYGHCTASCTLGPRCGDSTLQATSGEQCDDGVTNGASGDKCGATCQLRCGNAVLDIGEGCDNGAAANVGGYGQCNPNCTLGPRCGDGLPNGTEQCDDGKNDGSYGTCKANCTLANYCGDGTLTSPETCDLGAANSPTAYGKALCTNRCTPAPYCGDKAVDGQFGETCDDGVNSGMPGSCSIDCKSFVPLITCGNGMIQAPEQCDDGINNGTAADKCDAHCRLKCGNGIKDPGETCDNGVDNGAYGTCTTNCQIAGYCGDGIKNGPESCDDGAANVSSATAYGSGICTTACAFAPYCGDGRVQVNFGEQCDGTLSCDSTCKNVTPK